MNEHSWMSVACVGSFEIDFTFISVDVVVVFVKTRLCVSIDRYSCGCSQYQTQNAVYKQHSNTILQETWRCHGTARLISKMRFELRPLSAEQEGPRISTAVFCDIYLYSPHGQHKTAKTKTTIRVNRQANRHKSKYNLSKLTKNTLSMQQPVKSTLSPILYVPH